MATFKRIHGEVIIGHGLIQWLIAASLLVTAGLAAADDEEMISGPAAIEATTASSSASTSNSDTDAVLITRSNLKRIIDHVQRQKQEQVQASEQEAELQKALHELFEENSGMREQILSHNDQLNSMRDQLSQQKQKYDHTRNRSVRALRYLLAEVDQLTTALKDAESMGDVDVLLDRMRNEFGTAGPGSDQESSASARNKDGTVRSQPLNRNDPQLAAALNDVALAFQKQGKTERAEALMLWALVSFESTIGRENVTTASMMCNLANLYREQEQWAKAENFFTRGIHIYERELGPHHPQVADLLNRLGTVCKHRNKLKEAERLFLQSITAYQQSRGKKSAHLAAPLHNLALLHMQQEEYPHAELCLNEALRCIEQQYGAHHPYRHSVAQTLRILNELRGTPAFFEPVAPFEPAAPFESVVPVLRTPNNPVNHVGIEHPNEDAPAVSLADLPMKK